MSLQTPVSRVVCHGARIRLLAGTNSRVMSIKDCILEFRFLFIKFEYIFIRVFSMYCLSLIPISLANSLLYLGVDQIV